MMILDDRTTWVVIARFPSSHRVQRFCLVRVDHHFECDEQLLLYLLLFPNIYLKSITIAARIKAITYFHTFTHSLRTTKIGTWNHDFWKPSHFHFFFVCKFVCNRGCVINITQTENSDFLWNVSNTLSLTLFFFFSIIDLSNLAVEHKRQETSGGDKLLT